MAQCEHTFAANKVTGEVRCTLCGDFDDEMELVNKAESIKDEKDDFYATQVSFE
jgi:hypothetical protein